MDKSPLAGEPLPSCLLDVRVPVVVLQCALHCVGCLVPELREGLDGKGPFSANWQIQWPTSTAKLL